MRVTRLLLSLVFVSCAPSVRKPHEAPAGVEKWSDGIDWKQAGDETVELLQAYLKLDTMNPPGNETLGAEYLKSELAKDGLESTVHEFAPGRGSLIAKLKASAPSGEKPLCLLSHIDTVPAETEKWPSDTGPLSGVVKDGMVWGRGALDMKGMGALELQTFRLLARNKVKLHRDVILLAVADEEVAEGGMKLVTEKLWSEVDCGHVINEGGLGIKGLLSEGETTFAISVGEKGVFWARITAEGEAGHGSTPIDERAPTRLVKALAKFDTRKPTPRVQPAMYELLRREGAKNGGATGFVMQRPSLVDQFAMKKLLAKPTTRATITDTCQVTGFDGRGTAPNVIPSGASAIVDCRLLPGTTPKAMQEELEALIKDVPGVKVEVIQAFEAGVSDIDDPLFDALARQAVRGHANAIAGPAISPGFTDSILARAKGAKAYGFVPFDVTPEELATFHGRDERVSVANVHRGLEVLFRAVVDVTATAP